MRFVTIDLFLASFANILDVMISYSMELQRNSSKKRSIVELSNFEWIFDESLIC